MATQTDDVEELHASSVVPGGGICHCPLAPIACGRAWRRDSDVEAVDEVLVLGVVGNRVDEAVLKIAAAAADDQARTRRRGWGQT
jgi:hypothetical protein